MRRRDFLQTANLGAAVCLGGCASAMGVEPSCATPAAAARPTLKLRPYQLLCLVCSLGDEDGGPRDERYARLGEVIRNDPDVPVSLVCNAGDVYCYQDPGTQDDTPEGRDYNRKRDLDVLQILDLEPGATLPARAMLMTLLKRISTVAGLCAYPAATSAAWKGCPKAASGRYEQGHQKIGRAHV